MLWHAPGADEGRTSRNGRLQHRTWGPYRGATKGGKGAAVGAGIGGLLAVVEEVTVRRFLGSDFVLKKGRKESMELEADLQLPAP